MNNTIDSKMKLRKGINYLQTDELSCFSIAIEMWINQVASISFEVRAKEQFNPIKEQITEETENSNLNESDCSPFNDDV